MNKYGFEGISTTRPTRPIPTSSKSFKNGIRKGSESLKSIGRSLGFGVSRAVFPEDLKASENKILDPQDTFLLTWNKYFVASCILAVSIDPLFFYLPVFDESKTCLGIDNNLAIIATTLRTVVDVFYLIHMALQFRTAYIAPSSRVFGRGELVIDPGQIAKRYMRWYFIIDFLAVVPLPQIVVWRYLHTSRGSDVLATKQALLIIILLQYIPRFARIVPLTSELKRTAGVVAETAWAGAAYYLLLYMLASHIVGAFWYLLSVERKDTCWQRACERKHFNKNFLYCGNERMAGYDTWRDVSGQILKDACSTDGDNPPFDFGIFEQALSSGIVSSKNFVSKYCYCLWWGLQNLSTLGQGLETSTYPGESIFSIALAIFGLILFALLIGNMQTYLQSLTIRLEEMRVKRRDSEQWMHHRLLPQDLRERVRRYDQYKWLETRGVDEENLVQNLPKDLRRDIKRHLCLGLVKRVPLFENMDETLLDAICERLKPCLYTNNTYIVREGDPVDEMLFIIRGRLESATTDGGRSGFFNSGFLKEGDFCGEELLTWALDPKSGANLPSSTRTVKALREVEAFALPADELKFVAGQFRRLHSRQVQHTFRFYSQQWRTWAACFIQAAWRRYSKRKVLEQRRKEEEEAELAARKNGGGGGGGGGSGGKGDSKKAAVVDEDSEKSSGGELHYRSGPTVVEDEPVEFEVHVVDKEETSRSEKPLADFKSDSEVVREIQVQFDRASESGNELAKMLEVGKVPHNRKHAAYQVPSKMLNVFSPSLAIAASKYTSAETTDPSNLDAGIDLRTKSQHLSSTLHKLYLWEKKLFEEVKIEEKMRLLHEEKNRRLKRLDEKGAEPHKVDATRTLVRSLSTKIRIAIQVVDKISEQINRLRDDELWPQLNDFIQGLTRMWRSMLECHHSQTRAIGAAKRLDAIASHKHSSDDSLEATLQLEHELLNWTLRFSCWFGAQKGFVTSLNNWLLKCLLYIPEETADGPVPFSPSRIGAPTVFIICNQWAQAMERISDKEVVESMRDFVRIVLQLWERDKQEMRRRLVMHKNMERKVKDLEREDVKIHKELQVLDKRIVVGSSGDDNGISAVYQSETSKSVGAQTNLRLVFEAMERFTAASLKACEELLQRIEEDKISREQEKVL